MMNLDAISAVTVTAGLILCLLIAGCAGYVIGYWNGTRDRGEDEL